MDVMGLYEVRRYNHPIRVSICDSDEVKLKKLDESGSIPDIKSLPQGIEVDFIDLGVSVLALSKGDEQVAEVTDLKTRKSIVLNNGKTFHLIGLRVGEDALFVNAMIVREPDITVGA